MGWQPQIFGWKPLGENRHIPNPFNRAERTAAINEGAQNVRSVVNAGVNAQQSVVSTFTGAAEQANRTVANGARQVLPAGVGDVVAAPFDANANAARTVNQLNQGAGQAVRDTANVGTRVGAAVANQTADAVEDGANAVWQAGREMVQATDYRSNIAALNEGDRYQLGLGAEVKVGVGKGFADGDLDVRRTAQGYVVSASGRLGGGALAEAGGELGPLRATATAEATQAFGGRVEMTFRNAEDATRATETLLRQAATAAAATNPAAAVAAPLLQPSGDDLRFLANNISAVELSSTAAGLVSAGLGLNDKNNPVFAGLTGRASLEMGQTARLEMDGGRPSALVIRQDFGGRLEGRVGAGVGSGEGNDRVTGRSLDAIAGDVRGNIRLENRIPLPQNFDVGRITDGGYLRQTLGDMGRNAQQRVELTAQGSGRTIIPGLPINGGVKAKLEATGRASEILTPQVLDQFMRGDVSGAARTIGDRVQVRGSVTPFSNHGFDTRAGLSLMGVGGTLRGTAIRESQGQPLWQYQGTASGAARDLSTFVQQQQVSAQRLVAGAGSPR